MFLASKKGIWKIRLKSVLGGINCINTKRDLLERKSAKIPKPNLHESFIYFWTKKMRFLPHAWHDISWFRKFFDVIFFSKILHLTFSWFFFSVIRKRKKCYRKSKKKHSKNRHFEIHGFPHKCNFLCLSAMPTPTNQFLSSKNKIPSIFLQFTKKFESFLFV